MPAGIGNEMNENTEEYEAVTFGLADVMYCNCGNPMIPNISTGDEDGYGWSCTNFKCGDWSGGEIEAEDLIACGCPEWLAERLAKLSDVTQDLEMALKAIHDLVPASILPLYTK
jgi:hypothetical protein